MKAAFLETTGTPDVIRFGELPTPTPAEGEVRVRVAASAINPIDLYIRAGTVAMPLPKPFVPGCDLAGTVEESADPRFKPGAEVIVHSFGLGAEHDGGYAEFGRFPADWVIPLPKGLSLFEASALGVAGHTVALAIDLMELNGLSPASGKVLVNGATGGVASIAIDVLAQRGYQVVAMSGKAEQAEYLRQSLARYREERLSAQPPANRRKR